MPRPKKNNADYFSHDADMRNDPKIKAVRKKFGLEGYAVWCMLLETLTHSDGFELDWDELSIELIAPDFDLDSEQLNEMVDYFCKLKLVRIEKDILVCDKLIERFESLLSKRNRQRKSKISGVSVSENLVIASENLVIASENPQSKVKESKVKESKTIKVPSEDIDFIYSLYPTKCEGRKISTGKSSKNKDKIQSLIKKGLETRESLEAKINWYLKDRDMGRKVYLGGFGTFLNNLPDMEEVVEKKPKPYELISYYAKNNGKTLDQAHDVYDSLVIDGFKWTDNGELYNKLIEYGKL